MRDISATIDSYGSVFVQPHNNPDADAIACAWGMLQLAFHRGKRDARIIVGGKLTDFKPSVSELLERYQIPLEAIPQDLVLGPDALLIVVDAQYGAGNLQRIPAANVMVIDHHELEPRAVSESAVNYVLRDVRPGIGSCAAMVYHYLVHSGVPLGAALVTPLYYGMFMDTDGFMGKLTDPDRDARAALERSEHHDPKAFEVMRNSSLNFRDLWQLSDAIPTVERYGDIAFATVPECDDNLLGQIGDLFLQLHGIDIVVLHSKRQGSGYKLSIRSNHRYLIASRIAQALTRQIGSGGGHERKAGGYISNDLLNKHFPNVSVRLLLVSRMTEHLNGVDFLRTGVDDPLARFGRDSFFEARKIAFHVRYLQLDEHFAPGEQITVNSMEGPEAATIDDLVLVGPNNQIWPIGRDRFEQRYRRAPVPDGRACLSDDAREDYGFSLHSERSFKHFPAAAIRRLPTCESRESTAVLATPLRRQVIVRSGRRDLYGEAGDYLVYLDPDDYYVVQREFFERTYRRAER